MYCVCVCVRAGRHDRSGRAGEQPLVRGQVATRREHDGPGGYFLLAAVQPPGRYAPFIFYLLSPPLFLGLISIIPYAVAPTSGIREHFQMKACRPHVLLGIVARDDRRTYVITTPPMYAGIKDTKQMEKIKIRLAKIRRQTVGLSKDEFRDKVREVCPLLTLLSHRCRNVGRGLVPDWTVGCSWCRSSASAGSA